MPHPPTFPAHYGGQAWLPQAPVQATVQAALLPLQLPQNKTHKIPKVGAGVSSFDSRVLKKFGNKVLKQWIVLLCHKFCVV